MAILFDDYLYIMTKGELNKQAIGNLLSYCYSYEDISCILGLSVGTVVFYSSMLNNARKGKLIAKGQDVTHKVCTNPLCGLRKPISEFVFYQSRNRYLSRCRTCTTAAARDHDNRKGEAHVYALQSVRAKRYRENLNISYLHDILRNKYGIPGAEYPRPIVEALKKKIELAREIRKCE